MPHDLPVFSYTFTEGDQLPEIAGVLDDTDITGFTITLHLRKPDGTIAVIPAIILVAASGTFKFAWGATDLKAGLGQECEVQFINASSLALTSPKFIINVDEELA